MFSVNKSVKRKKSLLKVFFLFIVLFILIETIKIIGKLIRTIVIRRKMVIYI